MYNTFLFWNTDHRSSVRNSPEVKTENSNMAVRITTRVYLLPQADVLGRQDDPSRVHAVVVLHATFLILRAYSHK
jgi:hypothetical protein